MTDQQLERLVRVAGFTYARHLDGDTLNPRDDVREACLRNSCGKYGKCWTCPPACGTLDECRSKIRQYKHGILVQTVGDLEDEFDWDGMKAAEARHKTNFEILRQKLRISYPALLALGAGSCTICQACTYPDRPCRFPDRQISSMEAYGLLVLRVCKENGMEYYYGTSSVAYTSCFLLE